MTPRACPCGLPDGYADCCGRFHRAETTAPTAERLMRSRFSAFAVTDAAYLMRTWHPSTRPAALDLDPTLRWTGLEILSTTGGSALHTDGAVRFRASYRRHGKPGALEELSRFVVEQGRWYYVGPL